jgi:hypothetical protein
MGKDSGAVTRPNRHRSLRPAGSQLCLRRCHHTRRRLKLDGYSSACSDHPGRQFVATSVQRPRVGLGRGWDWREMDSSQPLPGGR